MRHRTPLRLLAGSALLAAMSLPTLSVAQANTPPVARIGDNISDNPAFYIFQADGSASSDADGTIVSYAWDFGDTVTGEGVSVGHGYLYPGTYTISLTVTDDDGATDTATRTIRVASADSGEDGINMMQIVTQLLVAPKAETDALLDRAVAAGADTIFLSDTKVTNHGLGTAPEAWLPKARDFLASARSRGLDVIVNTVSIGYCTEILGTDPNLAATMPVVDQPLVARSGRLKPQQTASPIANGGFEDRTGDVFGGFTLQDGPGERTFADTSVFRSGATSARLEAVPGESTRLRANFTLKPRHQYVLSAWVKTDNLSSNVWEFLVRDSNNTNRLLNTQYPSTPFSSSGDLNVRKYHRSPRNLTTDWTEVKFAFNSGDFSGEAELFIALFGGREGTLWVDDVKIVDSPALNWVVRDDLPVSAKLADGTPLVFGRDIAPIVDEKLGQSAYQGNFDGYHAAPVIKPLPGGRVREGDTVLLSGWHAQIAATGQMACSWNNDEVHAKIRQVHEVIERDLDPDGYLLNYDEIRQGGWEPSDTDTFPSSGAAMSASIRRGFESMKAVTPGADYYFWSDMLDPEHNAKADYAHIKGSLDGAWIGALPADEVTLVTWWENYDVEEKGRDSLQFFSDLGFKQVIGAYYDADVWDNYRLWTLARRDVDGVVGNMFASWFENYENLEEYGRLWWAD